MKLHFMIVLQLFATVHAQRVPWNRRYNGPMPQEILVDVINSFGFSLLQAHNENNDNNIAFSPYGAISVLVAIAEGVDGPALKEIICATNLPIDAAVTRVGLRDIHRHLKSYFLPKEGFLSGLSFSHENITLKESYKDLLRFYGFDVDSFSNVLYPSSTTSEVMYNTISASGREDGETSGTTIADTTTVRSTRKRVTTSRMRTTTEPITTSMMTTTEPVIETTTEATAITTSRTTTNGLTTDEPVITTISAAAPTTRTTTNDITTEEPVTTISAETTTRRTTTATNDITTNEPVITTTTPATVTTTTTNQPTTTTSPLSINVDSFTTVNQLNFTPNILTSTSTDTTTRIRTPTDSNPLIPNISLDTTTEINQLNFTPRIVTLTSVSTTNSGVTVDTSTVTSELNFTPNILAITRETGTENDQFSKTTITTTTTSANTQSIATDSEATTPLPMGSASIIVNRELATEKESETSTIKTFKRELPKNRIRNSKRKRSALDYLIANFYEKVVKGRSSRKSQQSLFFLANGRLKEPNVNFMTYNTMLPFCYIPHLNAMALSLPLDSPEYYLLLTLPVRDRGIDELIENLKSTSLQQIIGNLRPTRVKAVIPSFNLKGYVILTSTLQKLGIIKIFEPRRANFEKLTRDKNIYITNIEQAVTVKIRNYIDSNGLENEDSRGFEPVQFNADHPFLYFVMDSNLNMALMAGKIVNPLNSRIV